ncbi:Nramp family divalent metal transporter [Ferruginibacter lapsinanis]|uniref:Nramp family divalent metal transporter n=1 Tax=Ferruginibacter lapsinanis TaxID=563172 RepID=UPI001E591E1E|nr:Nramp family divalent metal transporter [Ferruginibacter lapsinanis]UEG50155.1 Nramp family divalent metal transporter [Ferruginibacter lapsinanis]
MNKNKDLSLSEVHESVDTTQKKQIGWRRILAFFGPAYLVSVGYMDPGNWATDLAGGSKFGYTLIWVLLMSNLMALLLQGLSARLGIVRGRDLAQANREAYPRVVNFILYILAEIAIAACDLAEVLGMAIGIQLLTGLPLVWGVSITVLDTFLLLYLQKMGMRKMEAFIITLVAIVAVCFLIEIILAKPNLSEVAVGFIPHFPDNEALYIAIGIIGATVMPHNLYLHSALVQTRKIERTDEGIKQALKFNRIDSTIALNLAFFVNAAILVVAATVFFKTGNSHVAEIKEAHRLLPGFLGNAAPVLFAVALIAAGQSSTITGTLAGQIIMEGYLSLRINPWLRRLITRLLAIIPALIVIIIYGEENIDALLVLSQVVLSLQLGFAIIPLIHFVSDKQKMGNFSIKLPTKIAAWLIASVLIFLNIKMLLNEAIPVFASPAIFPKIILLLFGLLFTGLLAYIVVHPFFSKYNTPPSIELHPDVYDLQNLAIPAFDHVAIALDFSENDEKLISFALGQGNINTEYHLIHIVESASASMLGKESDDYETRKDKERIDLYVSQLQTKGYKAAGSIGFKNRAKEIVRIVKDIDADMLVVGAHGHTGLKDLIYGETVNTVRHELKIPVLVVNV